MKRVDLVFRSVGERTMDEALRLAIENLQPNRVVHLEDVRPFSATVEKMMAIDHDADYVLYVDADCLILEDMRPFIEATDLCYVDCLVSDHFRGVVRAGVHLTRMDLVQAMQASWPTVAKNRRFHLRPESAIRTYAMEQMDLGHKGSTKRFNILHDAHQSYADLVAKYGLREIRDRDDKQQNLDRFERGWGDDPVFTVARAGIEHARRHVAGKISDADLTAFIDALPEAAEQVIAGLDLVEQEPFVLTDEERDRHVAAYEAVRRSVPTIFSIGLDRTLQETLVKALNILALDAVPLAQSEGLMAEAARGCFDSSPLRFYDGVVAGAVVPFFKALDRDNPGANFILTVRHEVRWAQALKGMWRRTKSARRTTALARAQEDMRRRIYGRYAWGWPGLPRLHRKHVREVLRHFEGRPDDLLVMNVAAGDGWEPLCRFLDLPVPVARFPYTGKLERQESFFRWFAGMCGRIRNARGHFRR